MLYNEDIKSDDIIRDISRVAHRLNSNCLSAKEYIQNGGMYNLKIFEDDFGSFANYCELAGLKLKID